MSDISYWEKVWERKGMDNTQDLRILDGFENTTANPKEIAKKIIEELNITEDTTVLEVACGAGMISQYINCKQYVGVDYSKSLVKKHIELLRNPVLHGQANNLIFKDNSFDYAFCFSAFQYFPNHEYAIQSINELKRVAKKAIFIGDIPLKSYVKEHLLYEKKFFEGWKIDNGYYNEQRFNAYLKLN